MSELTHPVEKRQEALRVAGILYEQNPEWVDFFRELLGTDGVVRRLFPTAEQMREFEKSTEYQRIQQMLTDLHQRSSKPDDKEQQRVITVRLPATLHDALRAEARIRDVSMNKLCIWKLLGAVNQELIEQQEEEPAGRTPNHRGGPEEPTE